MFVQEKIASKNFVGETDQKAYMKACKWVYENIYDSQDEVSSKIGFSIEKVENGNLPTCKLSLFCGVEEEEITESMCRACEDVHKLFYLNTIKECATCKIEPYRKRIKERLGVIKRHYVDKLFRKGKDEEW